MSIKKPGVFVRQEGTTEIPNIGTPGGSSLMVIFAVLCLTVFAILSLTTVLADGRLADSYAENVTEYYEASCRAEEKIAEIRAGNTPDGTEADGNVYTVLCPMNDSETLTVKVRIENGECEILSRTVEYTAEWNGDNSLNVWSGE